MTLLKEGGAGFIGSAKPRTGSFVVRCKPSSLLWGFCRLEALTLSATSGNNEFLFLQKYLNNVTAHEDNVYCGINSWRTQAIRSPVCLVFSFVPRGATKSAGSIT